MGHTRVIKRTSNDVWFLDIALRTAAQSTCMQRKYGAIIVDTSGTIVSTGYNGTPKGMPHCDDIKKCWRMEKGIPSGVFTELCRATHAEQNALIQAGKFSRGAVMYINGFDTRTGEWVDPTPCFLCSKMILNAEIREVVYIENDGCVRKAIPSVLYKYHLGKMEAVTG